MARRRKNRALKQLAIIAGVLAIIQIIYLLFPRASSVNFRDAIEATLAKQNVEPARKEQLRVQLALNDYKMRNKEGQYPESLEALIPDYWDEVPKNPDSGQPFKFLVKDGRLYVASAEEIDAMKGTSGAGDKSGVVLPSDVNSGTPLPQAIQKALIDTLSSATPSAPEFIYDPTGKRDPFMPFDFAPRREDREAKTPLEKYDIGQLKLTAVLAATDGDSTATVENAAGRGFIVKKGTKIGLYGGEVVDIKPDRIIVVETIVSFTGEKSTSTRELRLRTKDQEQSSSGEAKTR